MNKKYPPEWYKEQVATLTNLPTLPAIATEVLQIVRQDRLSVNQLYPLIEKDPPLAMKVLKIANSAYYGLKEKVESLRHAIVIIGMKELTHLVIGFSVIKAFRDDRGDHHKQWKSYKQHTDRWRQFWEHSSACGHIAELLNRQLRLTISSSPYSMGLLHDIGKLTLYKIDPSNYFDALETAHIEQCDVMLAEREVMGVDHAQVGKWITEKWQLPAPIIMAVGHHHHPNEVEDNALRLSTSLIQLADIVTNLRLFQFGTEFFKTIPPEEEGWSIINENSNALDGIDFEYFVMKIEDELETVRELAILRISSFTPNRSPSRDLKYLAL